MGTDAIGVSVGAARKYVDDAQSVTAGITQPDLRAGLSRLAEELLSDLPA
jgi:hypothetical protein